MNTLHVCFIIYNSGIGITLYIMYNQYYVISDGSLVIMIYVVLHCSPLLAKLTIDWNWILQHVCDGVSQFVMIDSVTVF